MRDKALCHKYFDTKKHLIRGYVDSCVTLCPTLRGRGGVVIIFWRTDWSSLRFWNSVRNRRCVFSKRQVFEVYDCNETFAFNAERCVHVYVCVNRCENMCACW